MMRRSPAQKEKKRETLETHHSLQTDKLLPIDNVSNHFDEVLRRGTTASITFSQPGDQQAFEGPCCSICPGPCGTQPRSNKTSEGLPTLPLCRASN